uniref:Plasmolipin n=1 Tax=Caligus clemensi TaxID=344056 RepID=C1C2H5_CALCM|nr:Plasmolipin [Caligus clemensi]
MSYPPPAEPNNGNGPPPPGDYGYPASTPSTHSSAPPPSYDTTSIRVSTDPTPGTVDTQIQLDIGYFKSIPGILKLIQLGFGLLCMILSAPARGFGYLYRGIPHYIYGEGQNHWFLFVVVITFIITLLWTFFYFLQLKNSIKNNLPFSWLKLEYFYTMVATILYITAFIVIFEGFGNCPGQTVCDERIAAGSFAIFNTIAYGLGTFFLHQE